MIRSGDRIIRGAGMRILHFLSRQRPFLNETYRGEVAEYEVARSRSTGADWPSYRTYAATQVGCDIDRKRHR